MLEPEAESATLQQRSVELTELLDAGHPVVGGSLPELAESKDLGVAAQRARQKAAAEIAAGRNPRRDGRAPTSHPQGQGGPAWQ